MSENQEIQSKPDHGTHIGIVAGNHVFPSEEFQVFLDDIQQRFNSVLLGAALLPKTYAKADLPVNVPRGSQTYVTDDATGEQPCFFDGTNWRRVVDRTVVA